MHNHNHTPPRQSTLYLAAGITLSFALIEAGVGWWSNSLALVSDAGHMLTDTTALLIASLGAWFATRRASRRFSYGFGKMEFIAAFVNGLLMLAVVTAVVYHAIERFSQPLAVKGEAVTADAPFFRCRLPRYFTNGSYTMNHLRQTHHDNYQAISIARH